MERVHLFGSHRSLVGVITDPEDQAGASDRPSVILLNAGMLHRVGPFRLYVHLARQLAARGFTVLRMDLAGIGDSEVRRDGKAHRERAEQDVRDGMLLLAETRQAKRFILMGLCSGADASFEVACKEPSVAGMALLDGYGYRTPRYYLRYYTLRFAKRGVWKRAVRKLRKGSGPRLGPHEMWSDLRDFPSRAEMEIRLTQLVERGVQMLWIYTRGVDEYYNHQVQFFEAFPTLKAGDHVDVVYNGEVEHTYRIKAHRDWVLNTIRDWMSRKYG